MTNQLHFRGDCAGFDTDRLLGPDLHGARYVITGGDYDKVTDISTVRLRPLGPAELGQFIDERRVETISEIENRMRICELFGMPL